MQADHRYAGRRGLGHGRSESSSIYEIDGDRVDAFVDQVLHGLYLLGHVAFAAGDDKVEIAAPRSLLGAVHLAEMKRVGEIDLNEADLRLVLGKRARRQK